MQRAVLCGAGGFIGSLLVKRLKTEGFWVRGVDLKKPEFSPTAADDFRILDLRRPENCAAALALDGGGRPDLVFQLAADMGGMGFIHSAECEILHNSMLINVHMVDTAARMGVPRYFYSSSVCVYRDMAPGEPEMPEAGAYRAARQRVRLGEALLRAHALAVRAQVRHAARIARFQNCYGPEGHLAGAARRRQPRSAARSRSRRRRRIEIWGDGSAVRSYTYVDDMVDGIYRLTFSDLEGPANIGSPQYVTVRELVEAVAAVAGKKVGIRSVPGPVGVRSRAFSNARIESLGWKARYDLLAGLRQTYPWVAAQATLQAAAKR